MPIVVTNEPEERLCRNFVETFSFLGKKWNGLIISSLCDKNKMRFKDLAHIIPGCSDRVLVERLKELESLSIVNRMVDSETGIISYSLTKKGSELKPVMGEIHEWADKWN